MKNLVWFDWSELIFAFYTLKPIKMNFLLIIGCVWGSRMLFINSVLYDYLVKGIVDNQNILRFFWPSSLSSHHAVYYFHSACRATLLQWFQLWKKRSKLEWKFSPCGAKCLFWFLGVLQSMLFSMIWLFGLFFALVRMRFGCCSSGLWYGYH